MTQEQKTITVTLSRAHKIADRIGAKISEARKLVETSRAGGASFSSRPTKAQQEAIIASAQSAFAAIENAAMLIAVQTQLRSVIGQANTLVGVDAILTRIEGNKRTIQLYSEAIKAVTPNYSALNIEGLESFEWPESAGSPYGSDPVVTAVKSEDVDRLIQKKTALERETFALQDELSDFNSAKVQVTLPAQLAHDLGL